MRDGLKCKIALFSLDENNPRIIAHCNAGGLATIVENGYVTICKGNWKIRVDKVVNIPLTFSGKAVFNIQNILPAVLAGFIRGFKIEEMRLALETFIPSPTQTPGRMNIFQFRNFQVMVDYAHNSAGFNAIAKFLEKVEAKPKVGIIAGVGDRRDEDIVNLGKIAAQMFDEIIIRQDKNLRGRTEQEIIDFMLSGVKSIDPNKEVKVIRSEIEAINYAINNAQKGSFIVICSDVVPDALEQVMKFKEEEDKFELAPTDFPTIAK
jgi:cyanophycin synthetase